MRTAERAYSDAIEQRYLFARCMVPYHHVARQVACEGLRILDAGCGAGSGAGVLTAARAHVAAVDLSRQDVAITVAAGRDIAGAVADVYSLPYATAAFDAAISCHVLEHLHHPRRYLRELRRVLRPGAQLWLITPNRVFSSPHGPPPNPFHVKEYFAHEFQALVASVFPGATWNGIEHARHRGVGRADETRQTVHRLDRLNLRRLMPPALKQMLRKLVGASYPTELRQVDVDDFAVGALDPQASVDLMAVATVA